MMATFTLVCVLAAVTLVMACGVWVATALIDAIRHVDRSSHVPPQER